MFKRKYLAFKSRLTTVGNEEPLNKLSLAVIILLDIFVLSLLFSGLDDHSAQLTSPKEYLPQEARSVFIDQDWSGSSRLTRLQELVLRDRKNYSYRYDSIFEDDRLQQMHPISRDFFEQVKALAKDKDVQSLFVARQKKVSEKQKLVRVQDKTKRAYDTLLLEQVANQEQKGEAEAIRNRSQDLTQQIEQLTKDLAEIAQEINANASVQKLWEFTNSSETTRQVVIDDFNRFERWYPLRELFWQLLFMLPIFVILYFWSGRSLKKDHRIQTLVASHLVVVAAIPILLKVIEIVVDLIPGYFFRNLFKMLKALHLIAIWHYLVIAIAIGVGIFFIYLIQKKIFSREKLMEKRLSKGSCIRCNKALPCGAAVCPFCGTPQMEACRKCQKSTPVGGAFCIHCGEKKTV